MTTNTVYNRIINPYGMVHKDKVSEIITARMKIKSTSPIEDSYQPTGRTEAAFIYPNQDYFVHETILKMMTLSRC